MINVIIADDNLQVRSQVRRILEKTALVRMAAEAANGYEAVGCVTHFPADILLLDIEMPLMSGVEVLEYLHRTKTSIKTLILSGYSDSELVRGALELGAVGFILKDEAFNALPHALAAVLENKVYISDLLKISSPGGWLANRQAGRPDLKPLQGSSAVT